MVRKCLAVTVGVFLIAASASAADADAAGTEPVLTRKVDERPATRGAALPVLYGTLAGLQAYDGWSTITAVKRGAVEANPTVAGAASNPGAMWALKIGATSASVFAAETLWRRHRRTEAITTMIAVNGIMAAVAARNASVMHGLK